MPGIGPGIGPPFRRISDTISPALVSAIIPADGLTIAMTYDEDLDTGSVPATGAYSLAGTSSAMASVGIVGAVVTLTVDTPIIAGETVLIDYTAGANPVRDLAENNAANLTNQATTNNSTIYADFLLTKTGNGTGVSTLSITVSENMTLRLSGVGRFYSDAGGTLNESTTWAVTTGASRTRYIRVPSTTSAMSIPENKVTKISAWVSSTNAASLSGDISVLSNLNHMEIRGSNSISGDISLLTSLVTLWVVGSNTLSGDIAALTSLTYLRMGGNNTLSGDLNPIVSDLTYCFLNPCDMDTYTAGATWGNCLITIAPTGTGYDSTEIDNILIDMAASVALISKVITLTGTSAARTAASNAAVATLEGVGRTCTVVTNP